ncbi:MAG: hypothetical protein ABR520_08300, partial [Mycobacteriales bacterium]
AFRLLMLAYAGVLLVSLGNQFFDSNRDLAAARARAGRSAEKQNAQFQEGIARCEGAKAAGQLPVDVECGPPVGSEKLTAPPEAFYNDPRFDFRRETPPHVKVIGGTLALIGFLVGATFAGADWSSGTVQSLLFWEPRRLRVMAAKIAALLTVIAGAAVTLLALLTGIEYLTAVVRGVVGDPTVGFYASLGLTGLRAVALAAFGSALGLGFAGLTRNTGAALGVGFLYFAVAENAVRGLRPGWRRFLVGENVNAWLDKAIVLADPHAQARGSEFVAVPREGFRLTMGRSGLTLGLYALTLLVVMTELFRRRDVT